MNLTDYIPPVILQSAWEFGPMAHFRDSGPGRPFEWEFRGDVHGVMSGLSDEDKTVTLMQLRSLWRFMKYGPVIIRPSADLGRALMDTEVRVPVPAYKQPFEVMGVELPAEVSGPFHPCLMVVWRPSDRIVCAWTMLKTGLSYYLKIGDDLPDIESRIALRTGVDDETDYRIMIQGGRLAINACLLSAHRAVDLAPLPREVRNRREANNGRVRRGAFQEFQELRFRDLVVKPRPRRDVMEGFRTLPKQRRSGHWRNVAHGPGFSLHRWAWIEEYVTRPDEPWPDGPPTTILR